MRRTIAAAMLASALGLPWVAVGAAGQTISTTLGLSRGLTSWTLNRSALVIAPSARVILGDDVVTAGSIPSRARFGVRTAWRARLIGSRKPGLEVIAKVRLAQCLQPDPALPIPPHPLRTERLELPHQHRRTTRMDPAALDRPGPTTPHQPPHPTAACSTAT